MKNFKLTAICASGLEALTQKEIQQFGGSDVEVSTGLVSWVGNLETAYRSCLWSRFASRVLMKIAEFNIVDEESLYENTLKQDWQEHMSVDNSFAVNCTISGKSPVVTHNRYAALKVKDGVADYFRNVAGERPSVQAQRPDVQLHVHIEDNRTSLFLDFSGETLHRRGYRASGTQAPLKETLGASIVALSGWQKTGGSLIDPMCGSGTLLIEAALMFGDSAPGLSRSYFGFLGWRGHNSELWQEIIDEAMARDDAGLEKKWPVIIGYDSDPVSVSAARKNVIKTGLEDYIQIKQAELATLMPPAKTGTVLSNLPYGERLSEKEVVAKLYRAYGRILKTRFSGWRAGAFISNAELTDSFGLQWEGKHRLYNGSIPCRLLTGKIPEEQEQRFVWQLPEKVETGEFGNRLQKNLKKMLKWADIENVSCFRIYDRDLPEYNVTVDIYSKWVHVQEYAAPKTIDEKISIQRLSTALEETRKVLGVRTNRVFVKKRTRQRGAQQYQKKGNTGKMFEVQEGECTFLVNFTDYLDTGLFLDHRPVRQRIFKEARGKRFLNLFGYTGTATVQAALGGAASTTTVDLSTTYLDWAKMNLALNGLDFKRNRVEAADCINWLKETSQMFDLIFIDPPTFSNTKKDKRVFDIQEDHLTLLKLSMDRLEKDGVAIFSTNFKRFKLDERVSSLYDVKEITKGTIPFDFSRNAKTHSCWEVRHNNIWQAGNKISDENTHS
jgi:23S rRNA (guanine2445-N2)-methyltransferase / 23S rRNA (guanine2069-N7)-methyltransferase